MAEILNLKHALELVGEDKELLKELMESFVNDKIPEESKLIELENQADTTEAAKYVHYFKGAGRQLGAEILAQAGQALEDVLRKRSEGDLITLNKSFLEEYARARSAIQEALEIL